MQLFPGHSEAKHYFFKSQLIDKTKIKHVQTSRKKNRNQCCKLVKIKVEVRAENNQCLFFSQTPLFMQISKEQNSSDLYGIVYCGGMVIQRGLSAGNRH